MAKGKGKKKVQKFMKSKTGKALKTVAIVGGVAGAAYGLSKTNAGKNIVSGIKKGAKSVKTKLKSKKKSSSSQSEELAASSGGDDLTSGIAKQATSVFKTKTPAADPSLDLESLKQIGAQVISDDTTTEISADTEKTEKEESNNTTMYLLLGCLAVGVLFLIK